MPLRVPSQFWTRSFSTSTRVRTAIQPQVYNPQFPTLSTSTPKLGRIGRWYLPTMALIAVGMTYLPSQLLSFSTFAPSRRSVTLDSANRTIGFGIANALEEHNLNRERRVLTQSEKNNMLLDAYGARSSPEDMERALQMTSQEGFFDQHERNRRLVEAYGEKTSLRDVERAMEIYEVQ